ncbi:HpcH/HpaI aldolase/citrate lyase family protein [Nocardioides sp. GXZ039]|uniref:HpcH/HpaI aldolase/citrate lyase family protein n=1 Tax=Nocardioides sp. GXZ039 TaxID=3136018 RepID=UPI0030F43BF8
MDSPLTALPRCALVVPASNPRMVAKALASTADEVVLDLEDAVAPAAKSEARDTVVETLTNAGPDGSRAPALAVRVNQIGSAWCHLDVLAVAGAIAAGAPAVTLVVPKVESAADVGFVDRLLRGALAEHGDPVGGRGRIAVDVLIETAAALRDLDQILSAASAASGDLVRAAIIGYADLGADLGREPGGDRWDAVRDRVVTAARAAGCGLVDGPWLGTAADEEFVHDRERARALGFDGTWVIHPAQIAEATRIYSPTGEQVDWAGRVVAALDAAIADGAGAVALDGQMLDEAVAVRARSILARAEAAR